MNSLSREELAPKTIVVEELPSEPAQFSHDLEVFTLSFLVLYIYFDLVLLFLIKKLLKRLILSNCLPKPFLILCDDPSLPLDPLRLLLLKRSLYRHILRLSQFLELLSPLLMSLGLLRIIKSPRRSLDAGKSLGWRNQLLLEKGKLVVEGLSVVLTSLDHG